MVHFILQRQSQPRCTAVIERRRSADWIAVRVVLPSVLAAVAMIPLSPASAQQEEPATGAVPDSTSSAPLRLERTVSPLPADAPVTIQDDPVARAKEDERPTQAAPISVLDGVTIAPDPAENPENRDSSNSKKRNLDFKPSLEANDYLGSTLETQKDARTFVLTVPAPRGMILDRNGIPFAQTKVVHYAAINFPTLKNASDAEVLIYAHQRIAEANRVAVASWSIEDDVIIAHYHNRRWLPLVFSSVLSDDQSDLLTPHQKEGLMLHPVYMRTYPHGEMAAHIIGYVGNRPPRRTGEIESGEELWGAGIGVDGLEKSFDAQLTGKPGKINVLFKADGTKVIEEMIVRPTPGQNVITTIDFEMQKLCERLLKDHVRRGAMVVMDVETGDILAMASNPQFDPNEFIPSISHEKYTALRNDPSKPLFARAFRAAYPPASTFKVPVALATLESGTVSMDTVYSCPTGYYIGDTYMRNWNKNGEGYMNVVGALTRSCNTWFYQAAIDTGAEPIVSMTDMLGFGRPTGIPLTSETAGFMPTNEWSMKERGYRLTSGDVANIAIGQGTVLASPLQVAHGMAGVGAGDRLMKTRLVMQVQDVSNRVTETFPPMTERNLLVDSYNIDIVRKGMEDVVNAGNGTGRAASHDKIKIAGKTGTGQWKSAINQNVAWFAGFAPAKHPVFSFAVLYEGKPDETVSGGKMGAPVVGEFFEEYLSDDKLAQLKERSEGFDIASNEVAEDRPEVKSIYSGGGSSSSGSGGGGDRPAQPKPAAEPEKKEGGLRGFFNRLRGR
jgi:penicillin-binding protein 2